MCFGRPADELAAHTSLKPLPPLHWSTKSQVRQFQNFLKKVKEPEKKNIETALNLSLQE